jgi:transposase
VNADGMPIAVEATPGQAHDVTAYGELMGQRDSDPGASLADKGYDSDAIRRDLRDRGAAPEIPPKSNRTVTYSVHKALYALHARVEHCVGHLKEHRRIATRYNKTESSYVGFGLLGCLRCWVRFVHRG